MMQRTNGTKMGGKVSNPSSNSSKKDQVVVGSTPWWHGGPASRVLGLTGFAVLTKQIKDGVILISNGEQQIEFKCDLQFKLLEKAIRMEFGEKLIFDYSREIHVTTKEYYSKGVNPELRELKIKQGNVGTNLKSISFDEYMDLDEIPADIGQVICTKKNQLKFFVGKDIVVDGEKFIVPIKEANVEGETDDQRLMQLLRKAHSKLSKMSFNELYEQECEKKKANGISLKMADLPEITERALEWLEVFGNNIPAEPSSRYLTFWAAEYYDNSTQKFLDVDGKQLSGEEARRRVTALNGIGANKKMLAAFRQICIDNGEGNTNEYVDAKTVIEKLLPVALESKTTINTASGHERDISSIISGWFLSKSSDIEISKDGKSIRHRIVPGRKAQSN